MAFAARRAQGTPRGERVDIRELSDTRRRLRTFHRQPPDGSVVPPEAPPDAHRPGLLLAVLGCRAVLGPRAVAPASDVARVVVVHAAAADAWICLGHVDQ